MLTVLATLEQCRGALADAGHRDTAHLVSLAVLELRMKLNHLGEDDLKLLCDEMVQADNTRKLRDGAAQPGQRRPPLLRLVK